MTDKTSIDPSDDIYTEFIQRNNNTGKSTLITDHNPSETKQGPFYFSNGDADSGGLVNIAGNYHCEIEVPAEKDRVPNFIGLLQQTGNFNESEILKEIFSFRDLIHDGNNVKVTGSGVSTGEEVDIDDQNDINVTSMARSTYMKLGKDPASRELKYEKDKNTNENVLTQILYKYPSDTYMINFTSGMPRYVNKCQWNYITDYITEQLNNVINFAICTNQIENSTFTPDLINMFLNIFFTVDSAGNIIPRYYSLRSGILPSLTNFAYKFAAAEKKEKTIPVWSDDLLKLPRGTVFFPDGKDRNQFTCFGEDNKSNKVLRWYPFTVNESDCFSYTCDENANDTYNLHTGMDHTGKDSKFNPVQRGLDESTIDKVMCYITTNDKKQGELVGNQIQTNINTEIAGGSISCGENNSVKPTMLSYKSSLTKRNQGTLMESKLPINQNSKEPYSKNNSFTIYSPNNLSLLDYDDIQTKQILDVRTEFMPEEVRNLSGFAYDDYYNNMFPVINTGYHDIDPLNYYNAQPNQKSPIVNSCDYNNLPFAEICNKKIEISNETLHEGAKGFPTNFGGIKFENANGLTWEEYEMPFDSLFTEKKVTPNISHHIKHCKWEHDARWDCHSFWRTLAWNDYAIFNNPSATSFYEYTPDNIYNLIGQFENNPLINYHYYTVKLFMYGNGNRNVVNINPSTGAVLNVEGTAQKMQMISDDVNKTNIINLNDNNTDYYFGEEIEYFFAGDCLQNIYNSYSSKTLTLEQLLSDPNNSKESILAFGFGDAYYVLAWNYDKVYSAWQGARSILLSYNKQTKNNEFLWNNPGAGVALAYFFTQIGSGGTKILYNKGHSVDSRLYRLNQYACETVWNTGKANELPNKGHELVVVPDLFKNEVYWFRSSEWGKNNCGEGKTNISYYDTPYNLNQYRPIYPYDIPRASDNGKYSLNKEYSRIHHANEKNDYLDHGGETENGIYTYNNAYYNWNMPFHLVSRAGYFLGAGGGQRFVDGFDNNENYGPAWRGLKMYGGHYINPNMKIRLPELWAYLTGLRNQNIYTDGQLMPRTFVCHYVTNPRTMVSSFENVRYPIPTNDAYKTALFTENCPVCAKTVKEVIAITKPAIQKWGTAIQQQANNIIKDIFTAVNKKKSACIAMIRAKYYVDHIPKSWINSGRTMYNTPLLPFVTTIGRLDQLSTYSNRVNMVYDKNNNIEFEGKLVADNPAIGIMTIEEKPMQVSSNVEISKAIMDNGTPITNMCWDLFNKMTTFSADCMGFIIPIPDHVNMSVIDCLNYTWRQGQPSIIPFYNIPTSTSQFKTFQDAVAQCSDMHLSFVGFIREDFVSENKSIFGEVDMYNGKKLFGSNEEANRTVKISCPSLTITPNSYGGGMSFNSGDIPEAIKTVKIDYDTTGRLVNMIMFTDVNTDDENVFKNFYYQNEIFGKSDTKKTTGTGVPVINFITVIDYSKTLPEDSCLQPTEVKTVL